MPYTVPEKGVLHWLKEAGLLQHSSGLGRLGVHEFRNLQMQVWHETIKIGCAKDFILA